MHIPFGSELYMPCVLSNKGSVSMTTDLHYPERERLTLPHALPPGEVEPQWTAGWLQGPTSGGLRYTGGHR